MIEQPPKLPPATRSQQLLQITTSILSLSKSPQISNRQKALSQAQQLASSGSPRAVQTLFNLTPQLISSMPRAELAQPLQLWAKMYNGSAEGFPDFGGFVREVGPAVVGLDQLGELHLKGKNEKIEFFDDSFVTETEDLEEQRNRCWQKVLYDLAEMESIREGVVSREKSIQKLEEDRNRIESFQRNYDERRRIQIRAESGIEGVRIVEKIEHELLWCESFLKAYEKFVKKEISYERFQQQLKLEQFVPMQVGQVRLSLANSNVQNKIIPTVNEYLKSSRKTGVKQQGISLTTKKNSQTATKLQVPLKVSDLNYSPVRIEAPPQPSPSPEQTPPKPPTYQQIITLQPQQYEHSNRQATTIPKNPRPEFTHHIPAASQQGAIDLTTPREVVIIKHRPNQESPGPGRLPIFEGMTGRSNDSFVNRLKLSDFVYEKQRRKEKAGQGQLHQTPDWIVEPFLQHFSSEDLFSRFRKTCLQKKSILFKNSEIEVTCRVQRQSYNVIRLQLSFRNLTERNLQVKTLYNITKSLKVTESGGVRPRFTLGADEVVHSFCLEVVQLWLKACVFELIVDGRAFPAIPLPVTVNRFVELGYVDREEFFVKWNHCQDHHYLDCRVLYSRKVLNAAQVTFLFPQMTELGRKQNYSYDEFGCAGSYEYYKLNWLMVFAFNVDSLLTIELLCTSPVTTTEQIEFLEYYLNSLAMLIQRVELE